MKRHQKQKYAVGARPTHGTVTPPRAVERCCCPVGRLGCERSERLETFSRVYFQKKKLAVPLESPVAHGSVKSGSHGAGAEHPEDVGQQFRSV